MATDNDFVNFILSSVSVAFVKYVKCWFCEKILCNVMFISKLFIVRIFNVTEAF